MADMLFVLENVLVCDTVKYQFRLLSYGSNSAFNATQQSEGEEFDWDWRYKLVVIILGIFTAELAKVVLNADNYAM